MIKVAKEIIGGSGIGLYMVLFEYKYTCVFENRKTKYSLCIFLLILPHVNVEL